MLRVRRPHRLVVLAVIAILALTGAVPLAWHASIEGRADRIDAMVERRRAAHVSLQDRVGATPGNLALAREVRCTLRSTLALRRDISSRMFRGTIVPVVLASFVAAGCGGTRSSSFRTSPGSAERYTGVVRVFAVAPPPGAEQVGIVEVDSVEELSRAVAEFQSRVGDLGGDVGVIDRYSTSFEMVSSTQQQSYSCGTQQAPRTCTRMVTTQTQVATLHLVGRAMTTRSSR